MAEKYSITTWMPTYDEARRVIQCLEGERYSHCLSMHNAIYEQWRSPEMKGKWVDPELYIPLVMSREDQELAYRIWRETDVSPRFIFHTVDLMQHHDLAIYPDDVITLAEAGVNFLRNDEATIAKIDQREGILEILSEVSAKGPGSEQEFLGSFQRFFVSYTTFSPKNPGTVALRHRLHNLRQRGLIEGNARSYRVTDLGLKYLRRARTGDEGDDPAIDELAKRNNSDARHRLSQYLSSMDPYQFEHIVQHLLELMGYDNVVVTPGGNDKGVDVIGDIELGISRVREVIQVKRQQSNVGRGILDSLRGSLHRFDAVRATIITTSGFSSGALDAAFEKGAAPITLIDGERLLDLLIEHEVGVRRREIKFFEFDGGSLSQFEVEDESEAP